MPFVFFNLKRLRVFSLLLLFMYISLTETRLDKSNAATLVFAKVMSPTVFNFFTLTTDALEIKTSPEQFCNLSKFNTKFSELVCTLSSALMFFRFLKLKDLSLGLNSNFAELSELKLLFSILSSSIPVPLI